MCTVTSQSGLPTRWSRGSIVASTTCQKKIYRGRYVLRQKKICQKKILSKEVRRYVRPQADRCTVVRGRCDIHATRQVLLSTHRTARRESGRERRSRETRAPAAPGPRRTSSKFDIYYLQSSLKYLAPMMPPGRDLKCPGCIYNY